MRSARLFQKHFLLFAANLVVFILIVGYAVYFLFARGFLQAQFSRDNINSLTGIARSVEYFLRKTDDVAKHYSLLDQEVLSYSYRRIVNDSRLYDFLNRLRNQRFLDDHLHSVYLYYRNQDKVIDIGESEIFTLYPQDSGLDRERRKGNFYDTGWLAALAAGAYNRDGYILLNTRPLYTLKDPSNPDNFERALANQHPNADVITVIRPFENRMEDPRGVVVANLSERALSRYLHNAAADSPQTSFILTAGGTVLSREDRKLLSKDLSGEGYVQRILGSPEPDGFFRSRVDGVASAVVYVKSRAVDWIYVSVVPYAYLTRDLNAVTRIIVAVIALIAVGAVAAQYMLTKKAYSPLEKVFDKIRSVSPDSKAQMGSGELAVIDGLIDGFKRNYDHLGKLVFDNRHLLKYDFLNRLLAGDCGTDGLENGLRDYGISFPGRTFTVISIGIDDLAATLSSLKLQDLYLMKQALIEVAEKVLQARHTAVGTIVDQGRIAVILNGVGEPDPGDIATLLGEVIAMAGRHLQISVSAGIGTACQSLEGLRRSHEESVIALRNRLHKGKNAVVRFTEVGPEKGEGGGAFSCAVEQTVDHMACGRKEKCLEAVTAMAEEMKGRNLNRAEVEAAFQELVVLARRKLVHADRSFQDLSGLTFTEALGAVAAEETLDGMCRAVRDLFAPLCDHFSETRRKHNAEAVSRVLSYMERNCAELLSLDVVADELKITPQYVSRLVKDITGRNFLDHLTGIRMAKAQELLVRTGLSVREIAEKVGYECYRTFLLHFRAHTSMIPTQYRKMKNRLVAARQE